MVLSAVPPPEASKPCWWGDHARALTAAQWSSNISKGLFDLLDQIINLLSLPPEQSCSLSIDHLSPHIYWLCDDNLAV